MFVVSRVESGNEGKAVAALLPQVIGDIQTAIGCGTLTRTSGVDLQVEVGDPVCQGDVIETAADGRIGIRFIDGTVFNLAGGTRMVLNEFVCDSSGTSHSALFGVARGTFAFIAGQVAKTGCLRVDTPVASIRSRANTGGAGLLSLAALTFSAMKEVWAADPNVTFLDDGSITYKDLEHGTFELVTKEAIPRHIFVEDPGQTIVLSARGSTVSVNQVANTATRMGELQAAQQDALANFARGLAPSGSSTPPFVNPLTPQPINFIQTDTSPAPQNALPPLPSIIDTVHDILIVHPPLTLNAGTGPTEIDTVVFDEFSATSGTFQASSPDSGATLTYGISGGITGSTVLGGVAYNVSRPGPYGTLYLNSATGAYIFVPDSDAINALTTITTESFTITASDGTHSANQTFTITINGTNDAAIISGAATGAVIEAGGVANATHGMPTATGTLTDTDVDNTPNTFTAVTSPTPSAGGHGTFTMTAAGVWTYTLNNADSAVQALNVGGTLTDTFTVTTVDGTAQVVTITINGTNDAAVIAGATTGAVIEAGGVANATHGMPTATGTLTDTDVDNTPNTFTAVTWPTPTTGGYGTFSMTAAGVWTYTLNNANSAVQALNVDGTLTDTFTVTTIDGTAQLVTITIHGTNDAAVISGATTGSVIEASDDTRGMPTATGTLTDTDVDNTPNTFTAVTSPTPSTGGYGTFTMTAAGAWIYMLDDANSAVQALDTGETLTDTFTVTTVDGTAQLVTITIHGTTDADPNDFDWLATGTHVISDPPYVYGTPKGETIAGGGDEGQIIYGGAGNDTVNGTGECDLLYGGSGNDTLKGNDGNDTIYGGSGSDTINGNNGSDTIVGGYGADFLTGGNGNDRFVYLSVADSNSGQFDTISDFISGSDRIELTALGALAFAILALDSASTSVPAHTIAWIHDSTTNQTIVYVNPTDQTLNIGSSSLLEIHLQGIATIQASDFIIEPTVAHAGVAGEPTNLQPTATAQYDGAVVTTTTADVPSASTVTDGALLAEANWTAQAADAGYSLDTGRDEIDVIGYARPASFDEVRTHPTEDTNSTAGMAPANGQSIALQRVHASELTENNFASDHTPVLHNPGAMTIDEGAMQLLSGTIHHTNITALNAAGDRAQLQVIEHGVTAEGDSWIAPSHGNSNTHSGTGSINTSSSPHHTHHAMPNSGQSGNSELILTSAGAIDATGAHVHTIDAGPGVVHNPGTPEEPGNHGSTVANSIRNSAGPWTENGNPAMAGQVHGHGHGLATMHSAGTADFEASTIANAVIGVEVAGAHALGDSFHFNDEISGFEGSDVVPLNVDFTQASVSHHGNAAGASGPHAISEEPQSIELSLPGHHSPANFSIIPDHAVGAVVSHVPHDLMV